MSRMNRREFVGTTITAVAATTEAAQSGTMTDQRPPNILFICSDTHQPDFAGYRGHPVINTPNLDRLARQGTHFTNCIHYSYYDDLLFDVQSDPEEFRNVIDTAQGRTARRELHELLLSLVDPTQLTERAFARQERMLAELCDRMSLEELLAFGFERRLGRGQAITLLKKYKG